MNDYLFFIPIALALAIGVISPGPSFLFVAQTAMNKSRIHGIATSLGTGALVLSLMAITGLFVVLQAIPVLYLVLKIFGGVYLFYIAYHMWQSANEPIVANTDSSLTNTSLKNEGSALSNVSLTEAYAIGLLTQLSNPKTAIVIGGIFMAFLPEQLPDYSIILLSLMAFVIDASWYVLVAIALTTPHAQRVYLRFKKSINRVASGLMGLLGLKLVFNQ